MFLVACSLLDNHYCWKSGRVYEETLALSQQIGIFAASQQLFEILEVAVNEILNEINDSFGKTIISWQTPLADQVMIAKRYYTKNAYVAEFFDLRKQQYDLFVEKENINDELEVNEISDDDLIDMMI